MEVTRLVGDEQGVDKKKMPPAHKKTLLSSKSITKILLLNLPFFSYAILNLEFVGEIIRSVWCCCRVSLTTKLLLGIGETTTIGCPFHRRRRVAEVPTLTDRGIDCRKKKTDVRLSQKKDRGMDCRNTALGTQMAETARDGEVEVFSVA
jgi:hypothetical protein